MDRRRKACSVERSREEIAVVNGEPDALSGVGIEIGMRGRESLCLSYRRVAKAVDVVMAVALGMGDAEEGAEREVLLHGKAGRQVRSSLVRKHFSPPVVHFAVRVALTIDL